MQFLLITKKNTLEDISKIIGYQNIDALLAENSLERTPKIGAAWYSKCDQLVASTPNNVSGARKSALLNGLTSSEEVFEKACLMDEDEWKIFSAFQAFRDALRVPESIQLPYSTKVIGAVLSNVSEASLGVNSVDTITYRAVMNGLKKDSTIDPTVFNTVNTQPAVKIDNTKIAQQSTKQYAFSLPWGKIQMYSSLLDDVMDFPAYPEQLSTGRSATYTSMPDIIYQYEPWIVYQNSGPREQTLNFHMHRDMWTGNHMDGRANKLIRFCEANTFPRYSGSAVLSPTVRLYVDGSLFIAGVLTSTAVDWSGPLGHDNWYLDFTLSLSIQEVSDTALNIDSVYKLGIIGS